MSRLRNQLLRLVVRVSALSASERRAVVTCIATRGKAHASRFHAVAISHECSASRLRNFSSFRVEQQTTSLQQATWTGCPEPLKQPCIKEYNGFSWQDEYSWMDPSPSSPGSAASPSGSRAAADPARRAELLQRHLRLEEQHTRRALAAAGVHAVKQRLLGELRDKYLGQQQQDPPPERLGPYFYSVVSGPDGGLLAYTRTPAPEPYAATAAVGEAQGHSRSAGGGGSGEAGHGRGRGGQQQRQSATRPRGLPGVEVEAEVLLSRETVARDARVASRMTGLRLGDSVGALKLCPRHRLLAYSLHALDRQAAAPRRCGGRCGGAGRFGAGGGRQVAAGALSGRGGPAGTGAAPRPAVRLAPPAAAGGERPAVLSGPGSHQGLGATAHQQQLEDQLRGPCARCRRPHLPPPSPRPAPHPGPRVLR
ncbi:hypothetical protein PLESTM_000633400 [Pleodorina starrii]|nr:hypothetical protein PLESTM_000633400 [Pleodorina starrii]